MLTGMTPTAEHHILPQAFLRGALCKPQQTLMVPHLALAPPAEDPMRPHTGSHMLHLRDSHMPLRAGKPMTLHMQTLMGRLAERHISHQPTARHLMASRHLMHRPPGRRSRQAPLQGAGLTTAATHMPCCKGTHVNADAGHVLGFSPSAKSHSVEIGVVRDVTLFLYVKLLLPLLAAIKRCFSAEWCIVDARS